MANEQVPGSTTDGMLTTSLSLPRRFSYRIDSSVSLFSRRTSGFGSRLGFGNTYLQFDDQGMYLSSLAVTVLACATAIIGIILFTLIVTLAVLVGQQCQGLPFALKSKANRCQSFMLNNELGNLQGFPLSKECDRYITEYVQTGQYILDFVGAVDAAREYLSTSVMGDGRDLVVMDIDDTALSTSPFYAVQQYGADKITKEMWDKWILSATAPPLEPMLSLYREIQAQNWGVAFISDRAGTHRNSTVKNLLKAGYDGWTALILRSSEELQMTTVEYKSKHRLNLQTQGYHIRSSLSDQWTGLTGLATGNRTFKLPDLVRPKFDSASHSVA